MNPVRLFVPALALATLAWAPVATTDAATSCSAESTDLSFMAVDGSSNVDGTATITVSCSTTAIALLSTVRIRMCLHIGDGAQGGGQANPRRMTNAFNDSLQFQIYRDAARTQIWGSASNSDVPTPLTTDFQYQVLLLGASYSTSFPMYARFPAQSGLAAGTFSNSFSGSHTLLQYRYSEPLLIGTPQWPNSCISGGTSGASITFPFTASATVPGNCAISTATDLVFGAVPGLIDTNRDQTSTITMTCTGRTAWNVELDNGQNAAGTNRRMRLGSSDEYVSYELYSDSARTRRWGMDPAALTGTGTGQVQELTVHGRVLAGQAVPAGLYRDTITVTVSY